VSGGNSTVLPLPLIVSCLVAAALLTRPLSPRSVNELRCGLFTASMLSIDIVEETGERLGEHESSVAVSSD